MADLNLVDLPDDVLRIILDFVDWHDVVNIKQTNSRFRTLADENSLWKHFCYKVFRFWAPRPFMLRGVLPPLSKRSIYSEWRELFQERYQGDRQARAALNSIISKSSSPEEGLERISLSGNDAKDALVEMGDHAAKYPDELARRYWAYTSLGYLHRVLALEQWTNPPAEEADTWGLDYLERYFGAFDLFMPDIAMNHDLTDFSAKLDEYAEEIRKDHADVQDQPPRQLGLTVAGWLRSHKLIGVQDGRDYHLLAHNFIGKALFGPTNDSLPIISVTIFCSVMRRLGVKACAAGLPFHVFTIVYPKSGQDLDGTALDDSEPAADPFYMDPWRTSEAVSKEDILLQTRTMGLSQPEVADLAIFPTHPMELVSRCAVNILNSLQASRHNPAHVLCEMDANAAQYAALWAFQIARGHWQRLDYLIRLYTEYFPYDIGLFEKYCSGPEHDEILDQLPPKETKKPPVKRRYPTAEETLALSEAVEAQRHHRSSDVLDSLMVVGNPQHFVGQVFRHRRYHYTAVVTGWDPHCMAGDEWRSRMGVDRMEAGGGQPFYHAFVKEDNSTRYVGEENIVPLAANEVFPEQFSIMIGKWFKNWDRDLGRFTSNLKEEYPDD